MVTYNEICEAVISAVSQVYGIDREELAQLFRKGLTDFCHGIRKTGRDIGRYEDVAALHKLIMNKLEAL